MKKLLLFLLSASFLTYGCYDDTAVIEQLKEQQSQLDEIKTLAAKQNTNIEAIQTIVEAIQKSDYVTSVAPINDGDEVIGYTIVFSQSGSVTLYNGKDGYVPSLGVKQDGDVWYWTVDGEWLADAEGNKICASAKDGETGAEGITPTLKIEDGYWYVSYDGGETWESESIGQATGDKGDSMFEKVTYDEEYVYVTMSDGQKLVLPLQKSNEDEAVFTNYLLTSYNVNSIYESYTQSASYRTDYFDYYGANTDVEIRSSSVDSEQNNYCQYKMSPTNQYFNRSGIYYIYAGNFNGIEKANRCISGLKKYGDIDNDAEMGGLYGEALVARALLYADLLNFYGEVPARFEPITQETIYLPKADKDVIYKQLLADLLEAGKYLDYKAQTVVTNPGKACAYGMYARLALQAVGYSCRPEEGKVNTGALGTIRKSNDPELQAEVLLPTALEVLEDVIQNSGLGLFENFEDIWRFYCNMGAVYGTAENPEIIYGLPFSDTRGQHLTRNAIRNLKYNKTANPRISINPALYFKYDKEDTRRYVSCNPAQYNSKGQADMTNASASLWACGKWRVDFRTDDYLKENNNAEDGCKYVYLRYADILLMAAEIANELEDLEKAKSYMRPVLVRAYQDETLADNYLSRLTDKEAFFDAIKDQRAFEFAGESLRRADLIRWGILKQALDDMKAELTHMRNLTGKFAVYPEYMYWRLKENGIDAEYYGFNPGETDAPPADDKGAWTKKKFLLGVGQTMIDNLYLGDPDLNMYRPIPEVIITDNMGILLNDYGYTF